VETKESYLNYQKTKQIPWPLFCEIRYARVGAVVVRVWIVQYGCARALFKRLILLQVDGTDER